MNVLIKDEYKNLDDCAHQKMLKDKYLIDYIIYSVSKDIIHQNNQIYLQFKIILILMIMKDFAIINLNIMVKTMMNMKLVRMDS